MYGSIGFCKQATCRCDCAIIFLGLLDDQSRGPFALCDSEEDPNVPSAAGGRIERSVRLLLLVQLLYRNRCLTVDELCLRLGVSERTMYYDLATLQAGPLYIPIEFTEYGYRIAPSWKL